MRNNQPVTDREIPFPKERYLVSKTDLKGQITFANDEFVKVSGFTQQELIGKSHNIVRHPDMPSWAFEDLWTTVKQGNPWRGLVKNRTKSGDYYWVEAFVVPVKQNGVITGYMSVRSEPSREQISAADALYRNAAGPSAVKKRTLSLHAKLMIGTFLSCSIIALMGLIGARDLQQGNKNLEEVYRSQMEPVLALQQSLALMDGAYKQVVLAEEHNPANPLAKLQDHPISSHVDLARSKIREIPGLIPKIAQFSEDEADKALLDAFNRASDAYIKSGLEPAISSLDAGRFEDAAMLTLKQVNPLHDAVREKGDAVQQHILDGIEARRQSGQRSYRDALWMTIGFGIIGTLGMFALSFFQSRGIERNLKQAITEFEFISEGTLTREIDTSRGDEFGQMSKSLAVMQTNIKVMLDNIREAVMALQQKSADLDAQMYVVLMQSRSQQTQVEEVATITGQFSDSVFHVAQQATDTAEIATSSQQMVVNCNATMEQSMAANAKVVDAVGESNRILTELNRSIMKIGDVTSTIRAIADQTNLLALNAAIEAARAGDEGRGFAVVADEVRKLAENTAHSTTLIAGIVGEIHRIADSAVVAMDQAVTEVDTGVSKMRDSVTELDRITDSSNRVTGMAQQISALANDQAEAGARVSGEMNQVAQTVEQNVQIALQASDVAKELLEVSTRMKKLMDGFQLFVYSEEEQVAMTQVSSSDFFEM